MTAKFERIPAAWRMYCSGFFGVMIISGAFYVGPKIGFLRYNTYTKCALVLLCLRVILGVMSSGAFDVVSQIGFLQYKKQAPFVLVLLSLEVIFGLMMIPRAIYPGSQIDFL